jgi:copper chaperone CopZ
VCAHAVRVSTKAIPGVESVNVSLEKGLAAVKMKPGNTAMLKQFKDAITKNGFTMKQAKIVVGGKIVNNGRKEQLRVSGSNEMLNLEGDASTLKANEGKTVTVTGTVPEAHKDKAPDTIQIENLQATP